MTYPLADPERELALSYAPAARRRALRALWALDERFGAIVAGTSDVSIGEMRLLWWREALARPADETPAEPLLREIADRVRPLGITGEELGAMAEGWHALLGEPLEDADIERFARERGGRLFALSARALECNRDVAAAGETWALVDLARRIGDRERSGRALAMACARSFAPPRRWPVALRPLGALFVLARSDARRGAPGRQATPPRVARMAWHRLSGR